MRRNRHCGRGEVRSSSGPFGIQVVLLGVWLTDQNTDAAEVGHEGQWSAHAVFCRPHHLSSMPLRIMLAVREIQSRDVQPRAQEALGRMYFFGQGVAQDFTQAARWYRLAAKQGHAAAQFNLGGLYYEGQGVPRDLVRASVWFSLAAVAGFEGAARNRNGVAGMLKPDELARAQTLVRTCQQSQLMDCD